jgi:hypothetical protein
LQDQALVHGAVLGEADRPRVAGGKILGAVLAIWVIFMAIGWVLAMLKTFIILGLAAVVVFIVVSLLARRPRQE